VSLTRHAEVRLQQRAIPPILIDLLERHGSEIRSNGADLLFFDKTARKRLKRYLGRSFRHFETYLDAYVVISDQGSVVTAGHRSKRVNRP